MSGHAASAARLKAGGIVSASSAAPKDLPTSTLCAQAHRHPALGSRVVVRLSEDFLIKAQTLEMEVLGFDESEDRGVVGQRRRRGLGFPAWALVNDPKHARFALEVVKEFKKEARRARSKPGHAKTGIDSIAEGLGKTVPHFLPSFYEEAGRAFIEASSSSYAAQCFEKAREAERVHALAVDEEERRRSFLEFALAGAVTIKSLAAYSKELQNGHEPATAYKHFRTLCVSRTLGGLPPWGTMAKELKQLAKKAGLDPKKEDAKLVEEIAEAPSLTRAPMDFWKSYRKPLAALAKGSPKLRGALLNLFPSPSSVKETFDGFWLELLDECGALEGLTAVADTVPDEAAPRGGAAAWLTRWAAHVTRNWKRRISPPQTFALLRRMADRLKADDKPVTFVDKWGRTLDLDLCEAALQLGISLSDPDQHKSFSLVSWAKHGAEEERGLNPVHISRDERYSPLLETALDKVMGGESFESLARERDGFNEVRRSWLTKALESLGHGALPGLESGILRFTKATNARTFTDFPAALETLQSVDAAPALARTLRGGIFDELGWPALEEAASDLDPDGAGKVKLELRGVFPYAIVTNATKAIVVGPKGRALEVDFDLPKGATLVDVYYSQNQLMVIYRQPGKKHQGFWSGQPSKHFEFEHGYYRGEENSICVELDDGAITFGDRALMAGDTERPKRNALYCDGETFYQKQWTGSTWKFKEFDPRTGELGRVSLPAFFEDFAEEGKALDINNSFLLPLPEGLTSSPLGSKDGMIGWCVRYPVTENRRQLPFVQRELETIDGRRWEGASRQLVPLALLRLPGDDQLHPITLKSGWRYGGELCLWDPGGDKRTALLSTKKRVYAAGTPVPLPLTFWHLLEARDDAGSKALRAITDDKARAMLDAARAEMSEGREVDLDTLEKTRLVIAKQLPEVTHPGLARGILGVVAEAAGLSKAHDKLVAARDPDAADDPATASAEITITEKQAIGALRSILGRQYGYSDLISQQIAATSAFFSREDRSIKKNTKVPSSMMGWHTLIGRIGAAAYIAARASTSDKHRAILKNLLMLWSDTIFDEASREGKIRTLVVVAESLPIQTSSEGYAWLFEHDGNDYLVKKSRNYHSSATRYTVVEHAPDGVFKPLPDAMIQDEWPSLKGWGGKASIRQFLTRLDEEGPFAFDATDATTLSEGTGLGYAEASLLWAGLPNIGDYSKNFLTKELREEMGLKVNEADAARETFTSRTPPNRANLFAASIPDDVDGLFDAEKRRGPEGHLGRLITAWNTLFGKRVALPPELIVAADKGLDAPLEPAAVLSALAKPASADILNKDGTWTILGNGGLLESGKPLDCSAVFTTEAAASFAAYIPYLFSELPVGDPIRHNLPDALARIRARLDSKDFVLPIGTLYGYGDEGEKTFKALFEGLGGEPVSGFVEARDTGLVFAARTNNYNASFFIRPALFREGEKPKELETLDKLDIGHGAYRIGSKYKRGVSPLMAVQYLRSESFTTMAERVKKTPVPEGAYETNPLHSAAEIVSEVGRKYDLNEDASVLYLQTLALIAPTTKAVRRWNDWTAARYKKAAQPLVKQKLVVEAKRARAGRSFFLPGPWEALKSPHPPIETWKLPLYQIRPDDEGQLIIPLERFLPLRPLHEIFHEAWRRVTNGDEPRFEEVRS